MAEYTNYNYEAASDAASMAEYFLDSIVESFLDNDGGASDDFANDYDGGDSYHHESHVDKEYRLLEAAAVLDQLSDHEETDSGLWEGLEPRRAVSCQAAFTYGNAVASHWFDLIETINEDDELQDLFSKYQEKAYEDATAETIKERIRERIRGLIKIYGA